jgi:hypothetical protein
MERQPHRRRRPALSCVECRRRKVKCDRADPCGHCVSAKIRCNYRIYNDHISGSQSQDGESSTSSAQTLIPLTPLTQASQTELARLRIEDDAPSQNVGITKANRDDALERTCSHDEVLNSLDDTPAAVRDLLQRVQRLENSAPPSRIPAAVLSEMSRDTLNRQVAPQSSQIMLTKTRLWRWSNWMGAADEVRNSQPVDGYPGAELIPGSSLQWYSAAIGKQSVKGMGQPSKDPRNSRSSRRSANCSKRPRQ